MELVANLENEIANDPYNVDLFKKLFLLNQCDLDSGKRDIYRNLFVSRFIGDAEFWLDYALNSIASVGICERLKRFELALEMTPDISIAMAFLYFADSLFESDQMEESRLRQCFETAISHCGFDILDGALIWDTYQIFEVNDHQDCQDTVEIQASKERIISLFHRHLALPMNGSNNTLAAFEKVLEEICVESDIDIIKPDQLSKSIELANKMLVPRIVFEDHVQSGYAAQTAHDSAQPDIGNTQNSQEEESLKNMWTSYIKFETQERQLERAARLYERALMMLPHWHQLWLEYADFAARKLKSWKLVRVVAVRALKCSTMYNNRTLRLLLLTSLEHLQAPAEEYDQAVTDALQSGMTSAEDYLAVLLQCCACKRRLLTAMIVSGTGSEADIELQIVALRTAFESTETFLNMHYSTWASGWLEYYKCRTAAEDHMGHLFASCSVLPVTEARQSKTNNIWQSALERFGASCWVWQEYIRWLQPCHTHCSSATSHLLTGTKLDSENILEAIRKIFRQGVGKVTAGTEVLCADWLQFELSFGSLESLDAAQTRINPIITAATIRWQAEQQQVQQKPDTTSKTKSVASSGAAGSNKKRPAADAANKSTTQVEVVDGNMASSNKKLRSCVEDKSEVEADMDTTKHDNSSHAPPQIHKLSVSNLTFSTPAAEVESYFSDCGRSIVKTELIMSKAGNSRGIVELSLDAAEAVDKAMALNGSIISGRPIKVELVTEAEQKRTNLKVAKEDAAAVPAGATNTVFVSKFGKSMTEEDIRAIFKDCGAIAVLVLARDKKTGESKGTCLIEFAKDEACAMALRLHKKVTDKDGSCMSILRSKFSAVSGSHSATPAAIATLTADSASGITAAGSEVSHTQANADCKIISMSLCNASNDNAAPASDAKISNPYNPYLSLSGSSGGQRHKGGLGFVSKQASGSTSIAATHDLSATKTTCFKPRALPKK